MAVIEGHGAVRTLRKEFFPASEGRMRKKQEEAHRGRDV
jgi:hypothetical protein